MLICITSDSHDRWDYLEKTVETANERACEHLLFAGDFIAATCMLFDTKTKAVEKIVLS